MYEKNGIVFCVCGLGYPAEAYIYIMFVTLPWSDMLLMLGSRSLRKKNTKVLWAGVGVSISSYGCPQIFIFFLSQNIILLESYK